MDFASSSISEILCLIFLDCLIFERSTSTINPGVIVEKDDVFGYVLDIIFVIALFEEI